MDANSDFLLKLIREKYSSAARIRIYEEYISKLESLGATPILSFKHLADLLNIEPAKLHHMAFKPHHYYRTFKIPKRAGGQRSIAAPSPELDVVHRWILNNILNPAFDNFPDCVTGYVRGKSIRHHVSPHVGAESLVKFDLKDFFPSIRVETVTDIFFKIGYVRSVARTLAALATVCDRLPQGASTSPALSNIYMSNFDRKLDSYSKDRGFTYTRYADDIVISGPSTLLEHLRELKFIFRSQGLLINHAKTRIYKPPDDIRFITGLLVKKDAIRLPKAMRRRIRVQTHLFLKYLDLLAVSNHIIEFNKFPSSWRDREAVLDPTFPERILGKLNYWLHIEPDSLYAKSAKKLITDKIENLG